MKLKDKIKNLINAEGDEKKNQQPAEAVYPEYEAEPKKPGKLSQIKDVLFSNGQSRNLDDDLQPRRKSRLMEIKDAAVGTVSAAKNKITAEKEAAIRKAKFLFFVWNIISIAFYTVTAVLSIIKSWNDDSPLSYIVLGVTLIYVVVFAIILLSKRKDKDEMFSEVNSYKSGFKLWKLILNIINTVLALLVMINTLGSEITGLEKYVVTILSVSWLIFKILLSVRGLIKYFAKRRKDKLKAQRKSEKLLGKQPRVVGDEGDYEE